MAQTPAFRGENFKGKWSLGSWAEQMIIRSINVSEHFCAVPYGKSEVSLTENKKEKKDYWNLHKARESSGKRPDILVFEKEVFDEMSKNIDFSSLLSDLPNNFESDIQDIVSVSLLAIESEASVWEGNKMSEYGRDWWNKIGRKVALKDKKKWSAPTVIVKDEDLQPLIDWQAFYEKPLYVVHLFYDMAFILDFVKLREYIENGTVKAEEQSYDDVKKLIYKTYYGLATEFGKFKTLPEIKPSYYQTKGGKFKPDLGFEGGEIEINQTTIDEWLSLKN